MKVVQRADAFYGSKAVDAFKFCANYGIKKPNRFVFLSGNLCLTGSP